MNIDYKLKQFLNSLKRYYVFGGKALSNILKNVNSHDWDIVIDPRYHKPISIINKLKSIFGSNITCKEQSFTRQKIGYHTTIWGCSLNGNDIIDFKFQEIDSNTPIVIIDNIVYLDIEGLYDNLIESIDDNLDILETYNDNKKKLNDTYIYSIINNEIREYQEMLDDSDIDDEEREDIIEDINNIKSKQHYNDIKNDITQSLIGMESDVKQAKNLINKNKRRVNILLEAINNPNLFKSDYLSELCYECMHSNKDIIRKVANIELKCNKLCPIIPYNNIYKYNRRYGITLRNKRKNNRIYIS